MVDINKTWSLGGINIAVEEDSLDYPRMRLNVIDILDCSGAHIHYGGTEAYNRDIKLVLFSDFYSVFAPLLDNNFYTLVSDQGTEGIYKVLSASPIRLQALNYAAPVYRVDVKLLKSGE